jgi:hypothetical protein
MKQPTAIRRFQQLLLFGTIAALLLWGKAPNGFYPWGVLTFGCGIASLCLRYYYAVPRAWTRLPDYIFLAGVLSNFAVMLANHGFMPVIDPWFRPMLCWKAALPTDHLLFLCDRIRLVGQNTTMGWIGALLPDSLLTARLGDFLMAGAMTLSIGDVLIFGSILLSVLWPNFTGKKRAPGEILRPILAFVAIVSLVLGLLACNALASYAGQATDPEFLVSLLFPVVCFCVAGCSIAKSRALRRRARAHRLQILAALNAGYPSQEVADYFKPAAYLRGTLRS